MTITIANDDIAILEEGVTTHSNTFAWRIPMDREAWHAAVHEVGKSQTQLGNRTANFSSLVLCFLLILALKQNIF